MDEIRKNLPPGFNDKALATNNQQVYKLNIPIMYSNRNPTWQQLTVNEADVLDPDVVMPRLDQNQMFAPVTEDVRMLEEEVNIYRTRMNDEELEQLQIEKEELQNQLNGARDDDDIHNKIRELDQKMNQRANELREKERRMRELEEENRRLEEELSRQIGSTPQKISQPAVNQVRKAAPPVDDSYRDPGSEERSRRSTNKNVLPREIPGLPPQPEEHLAYNYINKDDTLDLSNPMVGNNQYKIDGRPLAPPPPQKTVPQFEPQPQISPQRPLQLQQPARTYTQTTPTYTTYTPSTQPITTYRTTQPLAETRIITQAPTTTVQNTTSYRVEPQPYTAQRNEYRPTTIGSSTTYTIKGMKYTDQTLPPEYSFMRNS